jgi:type II secretory pathway pseudopilin PulG
LKHSETGFSLIENLFASLIVAFLLLAFSGLLGTYTTSHLKTVDLAFAHNLAQQHLDRVQAQLATQNSLAFDKQGRAKTYYLKSENLAVSQYFFNNFPTDINPQSGFMSEVPWPPGSTSVYKSYSDPTCYICNTFFDRNRFYTDGGEPKDLDGQPFTPSNAKGALSSADPPRYSVRLQLFGLPSSRLGVDNDVGLYIRPADKIDLTSANLTVPPASCPQLIADSNPNGNPQGTAGEYTGVLYIRNSSTNPELNFDRMVSKILVARVYRVKDFLTDYDNNFVVAKRHREIASASVIIPGRILLR